MLPLRPKPLATEQEKDVSRVSYLSLRGGICEATQDSFRLALIALSLIARW